MGWLGSAGQGEAPFGYCMTSPLQWLAVNLGLLRSAPSEGPTRIRHGLAQHRQDGTPLPSSLLGKATRPADW